MKKKAITITANNRQQDVIIESCEVVQFQKDESGGTTKEPIWVDKSLGLAQIKDRPKTVTIYVHDGVNTVKVEIPPYHILMLAEEINEISARESYTAVYDEYI